MATSLRLQSRPGTALQLAASGVKLCYPLPFPPALNPTKGPSPGLDAKPVCAASVPH
jgi:hypothetical protein